MAVGSLAAGAGNVSHTRMSQYITSALGATFTIFSYLSFQVSPAAQIVEIKVTVSPAESSKVTGSLWPLDPSSRLVDLGDWLCVSSSCSRSYSLHERYVWCVSNDWVLSLRFFFPVVPQRHRLCIRMYNVIGYVCSCCALRTLLLWVLCWYRPS